MAPDKLLGGLLGDTALTQRRAMAKAITLLESTRADHRVQADALLTALLPYTGKGFRLDEPRFSTSRCAMLMGSTASRKSGLL